MKSFFITGLITMSTCVGAQSIEPVSLKDFSHSQFESNCSSLKKVNPSKGVGVCKFFELDSEDDYGWRLTVFKKENKIWLKDIVGLSFKDAYTVEPYFYSDKDTLNESEILILLESAAEEYWGIDVYQWSYVESKPKRLGSITVAVNSMESSSLIEHINIIKTSLGYEFLINIDTILTSQSGTTHYPAGSIKYVEKNGSLMLIKAPK